MRVFVVHGRNHAVRDGLIEWLRDNGAEVPDWDEVVSETSKGSPFTWEVVLQGLAKADKVIVLFTPDEIVHLHPDLTQLGDPELQPKGQARPNVYLEAGYALGKDETRVVLVEMGDQALASDLSGHNTVRLNSSVGAQKALLVRLGLPKAELVEDERLQIPVFALPGSEKVIVSSDTVRGQAPIGEKGAFAFYSVFPSDSSDRWIESNRGEDALVVTWKISRDRIRVTRGARHTQQITPLDFAYTLNGIRYEKTLELID